MQKKLKSNEFYSNYHVNVFLPNLNLNIHNVALDAIVIVNNSSLKESS